MELQTNRLLRSLLLLGVFAVTGGARTEASESNIWPFWVGQYSEDTSTTSGTLQSWSSAGPFLFDGNLVPSGKAGGLRPLWVKKTDVAEGTSDSWILYPLFSYHTGRHGSRWSVFSLINSFNETAEKNAPGQQRDDGFDVWPFYFSRQTGKPETSYRAVFPIAGSTRNRLMQDRFTWVFFPLYGRWERNNVTTTTAPWPIVKVLSGEGNRGFELWPLFGWRSKEGAYSERFWLWPLGMYKRSSLWKGVPDEQLHVLPFYARTTGEHIRSESYLFPFFGYTDVTAPKRYHETRYLWPFFVQGRGESHYVNRWGPFYTHSVNSKGVDKTWVLWPLWKHLQWTESGLNQSRDQFLFWVYHSTVQRSASNSSLPAAHKTHLWPLLSSWDNGAGRKQFQLFSPFAVLFPKNEAMQLVWDPLFAVYRYDRRPAGAVKHSLLWNLVSYQREAASKEFHLGPILSVDTGPARGRVALGCGLLGFKRNEAGKWRPFAFDFKRRAKLASQP